MEPQENNIPDDIVQDAVPSHTEPLVDKFLPWHRVRKEYVRKLQWGHLTGRMVKRFWRELQDAGSVWSLDDPTTDEPFQMPSSVVHEKSLKCLVIPGQDLLDIRALHRDLGSLNCLIKYLGFNESHGSDRDGTRIHVANNVVTSLPRVARDSRVVHDRFESIARPDSVAYRYLKDYGPYHVVNLDFCGSMFPNTVESSQEYYNAIHRLLDYQFQNQTSEWLLFITTVVEPGIINNAGIQTLCTSTRNNYDAYTDFAERLSSLFPAGAFQDQDSKVNVAGMTEDQIVQLFGIALGKWLLALCQSATPKWSVALRRSYRYSVNDHAGAVMLSLAFEFKRNINPPVDPTGVSNFQTSMGTFFNEQQCAVKLVESIPNIKDVDAELVRDAALRNQLRDDHATLLEAAGYDRDAYLSWVEAGEVTTGG